MEKVLDDLTIELLAKRVGLRQKNLLELANIAPNLYSEKPIPKGKGGKRILEIPYPLLKSSQKNLLDKILHKIPTHPNLYGRPGTSIKNAVSEHIKKALVVTMDIRDFFPNTKAHKVKKAFVENGASQEIANLLTRLVTYKNHLPQGAPTSPCLGRMVLQPFAEQLENLLLSIPKTSFSIYFDDITISGPKGIKSIKNTIANILKRHGYEINKSKIFVMNRKMEQVSLNIKLNNRIEATEKFLQEIEELSKKLPPSHPSLKGKKAFEKFLLKKEN